MLAFPAAALPYASLQLSPRSVTLSAANPVGQIAMNSLDARDLIFDLEAVEWTQQGDADSFSATNDLVIVPPVYDVRPFRRMLVRIGLRHKASAEPSERAFQVRFREVLATDSHEQPRILTATVFLAPAERQGNIRYELQRSGDRAANLAVHNESNAHLYLNKIRLESAGQEVYAGSPGAYVLANNTRTLALQLTHALTGSEAQLTIENDENSSNTVDVPIH